VAFSAGGGGSSGWLEANWANASSASLGTSWFRGPKSHGVGRVRRWPE